MSNNSRSVGTPQSPRQSSTRAERSAQIERESVVDARRHEHDPAKPEADMLDQELPVEHEPEPLAPDPERVVLDDGGYDYPD